jgi:hypothetical protein
MQTNRVNNTDCSLKRFPNRSGLLYSNISIQYSNVIIIGLKRNCLKSTLSFETEVGNVRYQLGISYDDMNRAPNYVHKDFISNLDHQFLEKELESSVFYSRQLNHSHTITDALTETQPYPATHAAPIC